MSATNILPVRPPVPPPKNGRLALVAVFLVAIVVAVWATRPTVSRVPSINARMVTSNNLKQIGLAFQNYDAKYGALPLGAICDSAGKPLLSWRVALLPFLDEEDLYDQFRLDEPWDSPTNRPLIDRMPAVYTSPKLPPDANRGKTCYKTFVGINTIFQHSPRSTDEPGELEHLSHWTMQSLYGSRRGLSNLVLVAEAGEPVAWTKPDDFRYSEDGPLPNLTPLFTDSIFALMGDGSVRYIRPTGQNFEVALRASLDPENEPGAMFEE